MKFNYDVDLPERKAFRGGQRSEEALAIADFLQGTCKNMQIEYDDAATAKRRLTTLRDSKRKTEDGFLYDLYRVDNSLYVVRLSPAQVKEAKKARAAQKKGGRE